MRNKEQRNDESHEILIEPIGDEWRMIPEMGKTYHLEEVSKPNVLLENGDYRLFVINEENFIFFKRDNNICVDITLERFELINIKPIPDWNIFETEQLQLDMPNA